jgi:hypothetical protein
MTDHAGHFHAVRFYDDADSLCRIVGEFLGVGLENGEPALVIATPGHTASINACLRRRGLDVDALKHAGDYVTLDARATLAAFMVDALPNATLFRHTMSETLKRITRGHEHTTVRAYGEMVDVLWKDGLEAAAIRLETLWNQLANTYDFKLLCGYAMGNFYKGVALDEIRARHSHLVFDDGQPRPTIVQ